MGDGEGINDGIFVGNDVGKIVGKKVGLIDGALLGSGDVGGSVRDGDGKAEGMRLGTYIVGQRLEKVLAEGIILY